MTDRLAATALRLLAPRARALGTDDHDSLENIITDILPNGALCWVNSNETLYVLKKLSTAAPVDEAIIKPLAGPGRWFALVGALLEQFSFYAGLTTQPQTEVIIAVANQWTDLNFINPPPDWTTQDVVKGGGIVVPTEFWTIASPGPGIMTYSGPAATFLIEADATVFSVVGSPDQRVDIYLSKNGTFISAPSMADPVRAQRSRLAFPNNREVHLHVASRMALVAGDTVQLIIRNIDTTDSLRLPFIQLYVSPLF